MCVYVYKCMCVYTYIYIYVCVYVYITIDKCMYMHLTVALKIVPCDDTHVYLYMIDNNNMMLDGSHVKIGDIYVTDSMR